MDRLVASVKCRCLASKVLSIGPRQLTQVQIRVLRRFAARRRLTTPGNLGLAVRTTAILGGYLYRKNAPPPGHQTICMGWSRLTIMAELYELKD